MRYIIPALCFALLAYAGSRVVYRCANDVPSRAHLAALAVQAKAPYDDVEMTNAGYQLEWFQRMRGEEPVYRTPSFVRQW